MTIVTSLKERFPSTGAIGAYYLFHSLNNPQLDQLYITTNARFRSPRAWSLALAVFLLFIVVFGAGATIMLIIRDVKDSKQSPDSADSMTGISPKFLKSGKIPDEDVLCLKHCREGRSFVSCPCYWDECSCDLLSQSSLSLNSSESLNDERHYQNECLLFCNESLATFLVKCDEIDSDLCRGTVDVDLYEENE